MIWIAVAAAYLIGGLPFGYWLVRWRSPRTDLRLMGSGNPGATNALRVGGRTVGAATLVLDVLKGFTAVEIGRMLGVEETLLGAVALAAVVGHVASIWLGFRGGKGVATATGGLLTLAPIGLAAAAVVFAFLVAATRIVALGSIAAAATLPVAHWLLAWVGAADPSVIPWMLLISSLVLVRHQANLRRMWVGHEARLGVDPEHP